MLIRTHLVITLFFVLLLFNFADDKLIFALSSFVATFIPDIDSRFSKLGRKIPSRILQLFVKHRGIIHSFTFLFAIILIFILFFPKAIFGFSVGYGLHLVADSFTKSGINPFYPLKFKVRGFLKTGGVMENVLFFAGIFGCLLLVWKKFFIFF